MMCWCATLFVGNVLLELEPLLRGLQKEDKVGLK